MPERFLRKECLFQFGARVSKYLTKCELAQRSKNKASGGGPPLADHEQIVAAIAA